MKKKMNERGSVSYFMVFTVLSIITLILFALFIPMIMDFQVRIFESADDILADANAATSEIENATMRNAISRSLDNSIDSIDDQVDILSTFFQYSWILIILIIVIALFMFTRQTAELQIR